MFPLMAVGASKEFDLIIRLSIHAFGKQGLKDVPPRLFEFQSIEIFDVDEFIHFFFPKRFQIMIARIRLGKGTPFLMTIKIAFTSILNKRFRKVSSAKQK